MSARGGDPQAIGQVLAKAAGIDVQGSRTPSIKKVWFGAVRRTMQPVRRNSYHVGDREHTVWCHFKQIAGGSKREARRFAGILLKAARDFDREEKLAGRRNGPLGHVAHEVLRELLYLAGFSDGRLEPALLTLSERLKRSKAAIVAALARLKEHGFVTWIRRTEPVENPDPFGPQVKQASNAYGFDLVRLPKKIMRSVKAQLAKAPPPPADTFRAEPDPYQHRLAMIDSAPLAEQASLWDPDSPASTALDRLGAALEARENSGLPEEMNASSPDGLKPGDFGYTRSP